MSDWLIAGGITWTGGSVPCLPLSCTAQIRYRSKPRPVVVVAHGSNQLMVRFEAPEHAVAPGQAVVFFDGERVLGGGWIETGEAFERGQRREQHA